MEYRSNSHKSKEINAEDKKIEPVVRGAVRVKKDTVGKKLNDVFLADNVQNVGSYVIFDVIVPAITDMIVDGLTSGICMLFKGTPTSKRRSSSGGRTNYSSYSRSGFNDDRREKRSYSRNRYGVMDIIFDSRGDVEEVYDCMMDILDKYHMISVADYYELCKVGDQSNYTDRNYGWEDLPGLQVSKDRDGWRLELPRPEPFN